MAEAVLVDRHQQLVEVERELFRESLRDYIPEAWKAWSPSKAYLHNWHIDAIADHLQAVSTREIRRLIISIAPRHMKSMNTSVFWPTWEWTRRPQTQFLFASYSLDLALRDAVWSRRLMDSRWYQDRWGCKCHGEHAEDCTGFAFTSDQNVKSLYENDRGGRRLTASVAAGTTGEGGDILVMDDPLDIQEAHSAKARANAVNYFEDVWKGRQNDPQSSALVVIAQRTHQEDVTGHLLADGGWEHLCLPTEYEPRAQVHVTAIGFSDPRTEEGELLWPERFGPAEVAEGKRRPYTWAAQHQQRPSPASGGIIKREWMRFWRPKDIDLPPVRDREGREYLCIAVDIPDQQLQSWDTSFKEEAESIRKGQDPDPVSGGVWGRRGPDALLLDRVNERMDVVATTEAVRSMTKRWPAAITKLIEDKASGPAVRAILRREIPGLTPVTPVGSKVQRVMTAATTQKDSDARALAMVDLFAAGNVYLPHPVIAPWVWDYVEQLVTFPNAAHDDDVDMTSQALMWIQNKVWQEADAMEAMARRNGNAPPAKTTQEILRREVVAELEREKNPPKTINPWRIARK